MLIIVMSLFSGCCFRRESNSYEPPYPQSVVGWKYHEENGVGIVGEFVLKKGESTNNGEVQIKIVDLISPDTCADQGTTQSKKRAKIQFVRMADNKVMCEETFPTGGGNLCGKSLDEFWISSIGIRDINIRDQWVHILLTGAKK
jgi:hypothetical protein